MGVANVDCDDAIHNLTRDWDPDDEDAADAYTCSTWWPGKDNSKQIEQQLVDCTQDFLCELSNLADYAETLKNVK